MSGVTEEYPSQPCAAFIRRNADGEIREHRDDWYGGYIWSDGNYSCDCNRHLFFERAAGVEPEDERPCGHTRYSIAKIVAEDGAILYSEDEGVTTAEEDREYGDLI